MYVEHNCKPLFGKETLLLSMHSYYDDYCIKRKEMSLNWTNSKAINHFDHHSAPVVNKFEEVLLVLF
jgi:hypothetical protein